MNDKNKTIAVAVLAITAVILICAVVLLDRMPASSAQANSADRGGDYIMVSGATARVEDCVYVIDIASQIIGVYTANSAANRVDPIGRYQLKDAK